MPYKNAILISASGFQVFKPQRQPWAAPGSILYNSVFHPPSKICLSHHRSTDPCNGDAMCFLRGRNRGLKLR